MKKLAMLAVSTVLCALVFFEAPMSAQAAVSAGNDFARPGDVGYTAVYAADVLEQYLGTPLGETETYTATTSSTTIPRGPISPRKINLSFITARQLALPTLLRSFRRVRKRASLPLPHALIHIRHPIEV